jgi:CheY-like chemotaxis protein
MATILVADDEEAIRGLMSLILSTAGHEVVTAANGVEAVALYRSSPDRFDLVITDIKMPVMDGHQVVRLVRDSRPTARIICVSAYAEKDLPAGVEFLNKPFSAEALRTLVRQVLER